MTRLRRSSQFFHYIFPQESIIISLNKLKAELEPGNYKIRIVLKKNGEFLLEYFTLDLASLANNFFIAIADAAVNSHNILFKHKTSSSSVRGFYDYQMCRAKEKLPIDELIFLNEKGEITEGSRSNIFIEKSGKLYTPPETCGLLAGIIRNKLLESNSNVHEAILYPHDLLIADKIFLTNSILNIKRVELITLKDYSPESVRLFTSLGTY